MAKHSAHEVPLHNVDDWDARNVIMAAMESLVDESDNVAQWNSTGYARHSTGELDAIAERDALSEWFGID